MSKEIGSYDVQAKVKSVKGTCGFGHKVGDTIRFERGVKGEICYTALLVLLPHFYALRYGAEFPWAWHNRPDGDTLEVACPDAENPVVFELKRTR